MKLKGVILKMAKMICDKCKKEFLEEEIHEHHLHPKFMNNKEGKGRKVQLCPKCHNILHLIIPSIIWKYVKEKEKCILSLMVFTKNWVKKNG